MSLPSTGDVIGGKYRVGSAIAEGGMGVVHDGVHVQLEEPVAIKFLKPDVVTAGDEVVKRFMREARTCSKIRSEHVVRVLDVDTLPSGIPYMVMERLTGRDLDAIVEVSGPLDVTSAVDYVLQALEALAEAHAQGIVHRDLKPANLFLSERADGSPCIKVLDFGISKIERGTDGGMTHTQAVMGSPRYMSPEQLRASRDVDARADIWAMGVVLYELLTGRAPFDGGSMTQIAAAILENVPAPLGLRSEHAAAVEAVVMRCLAKRAADRFANVAELAAALAPCGSPAAARSTARVQGVLQRGGVPTASQPALPSVATGVHRPPSGTDVTWGDTKTPGRSSRRLGVVAAISACAVVAALVSIFVVLRTTDDARVSAASAAPPAASSSALALAAPSPPPPTVIEPVASVAPKLAASSIAPAEPPPPASVVSAHQAAIPPRPAPKARPTATPPTPAPTPSPGMWSDRK